MTGAHITTIYTPDMGLRALFGDLMSTGGLSREKSMDWLCGVSRLKQADMSAWLTGQETITTDHGPVLLDLAMSSGKDVRTLSYRAIARMMDDEEAAGMMEDEEEKGEMGDDDKPDSYRFVLSDGASDRARDIVDQSWVLEEFTANPVAPFGHNYSAPAVGTWRNVAVRNGALTGRLVPFALESYPLSMTVAAQLRARVLRTVSVGFMPGSTIRRGDLPEDDPRYSGRGGLIFVQNNLMECSPTPVPMNPRALMRDVQVLKSARTADDHLADLTRKIFGI
jgi:hypothetical protein